MVRMPDFLIIGAPKSGTTSLYFYLQQHPQIFMPVSKEPFFFAFEDQDMSKYHFHDNMQGARNTIVKLDDYQKLFENVPASRKAGEASTEYLHVPISAKRIHHHVPKVKMIAILRNPVDRAYSHFLHFRRDGFEPCTDFMEAIKAEPLRIRENWFPSYQYLNSGFYGQQLKNFYNFFPRSQLKVFLYEDLKQSDTMMEEVFKHLEVDQILIKDTTSRHNISGTVRFPWLYNKIRGPGKIKSIGRRYISPEIWSRLRANWEKMFIAPPIPLSDDYRRQLIAIYRDDILELQSLIDRDLSSWLCL